MVYFLHVVYLRQKITGDRIYLRFYPSFYGLFWKVLLSGSKYILSALGIMFSLILLGRGISIILSYFAILEMALSFSTAFVIALSVYQIWKGDILNYDMRIPSPIIIDLRAKLIICSNAEFRFTDFFKVECHIKSSKVGYSYNTLKHVTIKLREKTMVEILSRRGYVYQWGIEVAKAIAEHTGLDVEYRINTREENHLVDISETAIQLLRGETGMSVQILDSRNKLIMLVCGFTLLAIISLEIMIALLGLFLAIEVGLNAVNRL